MEVPHTNWGNTQIFCSVRVMMYKCISTVLGIYAEKNFSFVQPNIS